MADDFDKLAVLIEANTKSYENAMKKIMAKTDDAMKRVEGRTAQTERAMSRLSMGGDKVAAMFGRLGVALAAGLSVQQAVRFADTFTQVQNGLRVAGLEGERLEEVYGKLLNSAQRNAAPLQSLTDLYSKLSLSQKELGINSDQLIGFTDRVALALRVGGTSASEASGALLQMSQALGGGVVRAEEFNSMLEGTPTIVQAVARGLTEAGGSVAKLRHLVNDGTVSSKAFFEAFLAGSADLEAKAANQTLTTSQAFQTLNNALVDAVGKLDGATGATAEFNKAVAATAAFIGKIGDAIAENKPQIEGWAATLRDAAKYLENFGPLGGVRQLGAVFGQIGDAFTKDAAEQVEALEIQADALRKMGQDASETEARIAALKATMASLSGLDMDRARREPSGTNPAPRTVSIANFKADTSAPRSASGGARRSREKREDPFKDFGFSDETINSVDDYRYMLETLEQQTDRNREAFKSLADQIVGGFVEGKSAAEVFSGTLKSLGSKLLDVGLNALVSGLFPAPRVDAWAGLRFRAAGGPVSASTPYIVGEKGPELFIPQASGNIVSNRNMPAGGGRMDVRVFVDDDGRLQAAIDRRTDARIERYEQGSYQRHVANMRAAQRYGQR